MTAATTAAAASSTQATINTSLASLANNSQTFLKLLTTQLKNQDPLSPLDTNQFTQQLTQMSGVEQQLLGNQLLQQLVSEQGGVAQAANLIGTTVTAPGATSSSAPISGTVTSVEQINGQTMLNIGGQQVPFSSITSVTIGSTTTPSAAATGQGA